MASAEVQRCSVLLSSFTFRLLCILPVSLVETRLCWLCPHVGANHFEAPNKLVLGIVVDVFALWFSFILLYFTIVNMFIFLKTINMAARAESIS